MKVSFSNTDEEAKALKEISRLHSQFTWKLAVHQRSAHWLASGWFNCGSTALFSLCSFW